jgi:hypothetical protein
MAPKDPTAPKVSADDMKVGGPVAPRPPSKMPQDLDLGGARGKGMDPSGGNSSDDDLDGLARTRAEREKERRAAEEELRLGKQKALQQANARAGLGGFGLSGGTAALVSDIGRQQDRSATLAMADLGRRQRDEDFTAIQRLAAITDLEDAYQQDLDGDGRIAGELPITGGTQEDRNKQVADRLSDNAERATSGYADAPVRDVSYTDAAAEHGRPIAADASFGFFRDAETGQVFKVKKP